jgi:hypothetical protein
MLLYAYENWSFVTFLSIFAEPIVFKIPTTLYNGIEIPIRIPWSFKRW